MFERFHRDARAVIEHAQGEAARSGQREVGTGHLLLGLLTQPGDAADALAAAGADADDLRARLPNADGAGAPSGAGSPEEAGPGQASPDQATAGQAGPAQASPGQASPGQASTAQASTAQAGRPGVVDGMRMTREARRALEGAQRTAQRLKHQHVSSGHLLLGIIDEPGSPTAGVLTVAGIHVGTLRADVLRRLEAGQDPVQR